MPGTYQYDVEIKSNVAKLLSDMKQVQDRLDTVEGKEYKIKLNVDEKKLSSVISNLEKMLDSLGKETGDFKQFENLSKELSSIVSEVQSLSKAFGKVDDSGAKTLLSSIQNIDKSLSELSQNILNVNKNMSNMGGNTSGAVKQVENITNESKKAASALEDVAKAQEKVNGQKTNISSESKVDEVVSSAKDLDNTLNQIDIPTDSFDKVLEKLDRTKSELVDIVKITKQSVSDADGKFHDSYTLKDSRGSTEIYGMNSKTDKGQILRQNIVGYDAKKDTELIQKNKTAYEELTEAIRQYSEVSKRVSSGKAKDDDIEKMSQLEEKISQLQKQPILSDSQVAKSESALVSLYDQLDKIERKLQETNQKQVGSGFGKLFTYQSKIDKYNTTINRFNDGGWTSSAYLDNVQAVKNAVKEYETLLNELKGKDASLVTSEDINRLDNYEKKIKDTIATVTNMSASEKGYNFVSGQKELDKIHKLLNENSKMSSEAKAKIKAYYAEIESGNPSMSLDKIHGEILKIYNAEVEAGRAGRTLFDTLKNSGFHQIAAQMAGMFGVYDIINLGKEGFNVVRELNTALTEMRKVSDESLQSLKNYQATTFDTADSVGTTAKQIQNSTADWMRLGESMNQAAESAKDANVLLNVSEFEGIDEATESLVSMSQAYKDLDKMDIINVLNNIGNNYSISTDGLATALKDSASALVTANNDLNEAVSLTTAGNAITQDPSKVGAGLRTISLRLVGTEEAKKELSDLGEETDGMITTVSKLRDIIMDATKAASSDGKGFDIFDSNGNYKSTYEIMQGLADLYDNIVKKDKELGTNNLNLLLETIAGKNRANIAASILQNGDMLRSVYEDAQNSEGSAEKELNSYLDSIDGKMAQLENRAQEFWFKVIDSETIKNGIDLLSTLLKGATDFVDTVGLLPTILTGIGAALSFKNVGRDKMYSLSF